MPKQFLSINEAAARLGVSTKTLRRWEEKGIISPKRTVGNQRRYSLADIEKADKQSLTINEAAERLGLSAKTLRRWEEKGIIAPQRTSGNQRRYAVSEIEALKDQNPKPIISTKVKKQAEKDLSVLEKERFFDIASIKVTHEPKIRPVVSYQSPVITSDSEAISSVRHPELVSGSSTSTNEILNQVQNDKLIRNDKYRLINKYILTKQSAAWGGAFLSVAALFLFINSMNQISIPVKLLSLLPYFNSTDKTKNSKVTSGNAVLATETTKKDYTLKISVPAEFLSTASVSGKLTAPNILYSVVAGNNITISGDPQNPTISAGVALDAGTGLAITSGVITNTDPGSAQDIFGKIKVGSNTITASSNTDTFELAAGDNISLSADTSSKKITISGSSSSTGVTVQEGDTTVSSTANTIDFLGGDFDVGESPTGEANVSLASTLTSVTGVAGNFAVGGNLTVGSDTISDITGNGLAVSSNTLAINLTTSGTTGSTSSNSGLEVGSAGLTLLKGCADNEILKYTDAGGWACSPDAGTGAAVGGTGAQNQVAFWTNATTISGSNNFYWDAANEKFGIGTNGAPDGKIEVTGAATGKALAILNETGDQNIITASASGITQLNLDRSGNLAIEGSISDLSDTALTVNDDLKVVGNHIIDSGNTTRITLGATNTITGSNLTLSGTSTLDATSLTAINGGATAINFTDFTVNGTTGSVTIDNPSNTGAVTVEGTSLNIDSLNFVAAGSITTAAGNDLTLSPGGSHVLLNSSSTLNVGGAAGTAYNFFANSTAGATLPATNKDLYIQGALEVDGQTRLGNITYTWPGSIGGNNYLLQTQTDGTLAWIDSSTLGTNYWDQISGVLTPKIETQDLLLGSQSTTSAKFAFINVNSGTPTASISAISTNNALSLDAAGNIFTTNKQSLTLGSASTGNIVIGNTGFTTCSALTTVSGVLTCSSSSTGTNYWQLANGAVSPFSETLDVLIGATATSSAEFAVTGIAAGTPTASLSATTNNYGLSLNASNATIQSLNKGTLTIGGSTTGDIVLSGFATGIIHATNGVLSSSAVNLAGSDVTGILTTSKGGTGADLSAAAQYSIPYFSAAGVLGGALAPSTAGYVLTTNSTGAAPSWVDSSTIGTNYWDQSSGVLTPKIETQDLLLGSNATSSARFAFINVNSGTPTATISGTGNNALSLNGDGTIQTTNRQSLTLGNAATGNIVLGNGSFTTAGGVLYTNASGVLLQTGAGGGTQCLTGGATPSWTDCGGAAGDDWNFANGALSPKYASVTDLLLGNTATNAAQFAVTGISAGTPTASLSATTNSNGLSLNASNSTIQSLNRGTLTLGGSTTGNIVLSGRNGSSNSIYFTGYDCSALSNGGALTVDANGLVQCSADDSAAGGGTLNIKEGGSTIVTAATDMNFAASDFTITAESGTQGGVAIDYGNSGITRRNNAEVIGGQWSFLSDILAGGTSTSSARFAVLNMMGSGTPTASISAISTNNALSLDAAGNIFTTNKQTLTLGSASTGNIVIGNTGFTTCSALTTVSGVLTCGSDSTGTNYWQLANGAISPFSETIDLLLGSTATSSAEFAVTGIAAGTPTATLSATTNNYGLSLNASNAQIQSLNLGTLTLGGATTGNIVIDSGSSLITLSDPTSLSSTLNVSGTLTANGDVVLGDAITDNITFNGRVTQDADLIPITTTGTNDLGSASLPWDNLYVGSITQNGATLDATYAPINANFITVTANGTLTGETGIDALTTAISTTSTLNVDGASTLGAVTLDPNANLILSSGTGKLGIGVSSPLAALDVHGNSGTTSVATISGTTSFASLVVDNTIGDLFTASASGLSRFTIAQNGVLYTNGIAGQTVGTASCVTTTNGIVTGTSSCPSVTANDIWQTGSGTIFEGNTTQDLLIGGVSTASAKFAVLNVAGTTPIASLSATAGSTYLTADGQLITTNKQTLTLGNSTTGDIALGTDATQRTITIGNATSGTALNFDTGTGGINIGDNANIKTIDIGGNTNSGTDTIRIATEGTAADTITIGNNNASTTLALTGGTAWSISTAGLATFTQLNVDSLTLNNTSLSSTGDLTLDATGGDVVSSDRFTLGSQTATTLATLDVQALSGTLSVATISGKTSFATLVIDNSGAGDIFTASAAGRQRLTLTNSGELRMYDADASNYTGFKTPSNITSNAIYTLPTALPVSNNYVLISQTDGTLSWTDAGSLPSVNFWETANGAIYPKNADSFDLLLGSTATSSAEFAVTGISAGSPVATLSATTNTYGLSLSASDSTIQSLNKQTLTLGGTTTGNISLFNMTIANAGLTIPSGQNFTLSGLTQGSVPFIGANGVLTQDNASLFFDDSNNRLGIGTNTNLAGALDVRATSGTLPEATLSGRTSFAGLVVDNGVGDLFTASSSGLNRFVIKQNGNVGIGTNNPTQALDIAGNATASGSLTLGGVFQVGAPVAGPVAYNRIGYATTSHGLDASNDLFLSGKLEVDGSLFIDGNLIAGGTVGTVGWFQRNGGALAPANLTDDLLLGSTSTASARFAFTNAVGPGTPTASIAAITTNNALSLDANGNITTTNEQSLTLGNAATGDINLTVGTGNNLRINGTAGADIAVATCVTAAKGIVTGTGSCTSPTNIYLWSTSSDGKSIIEGNTTQDLLLGGTATTSAKFAVLNVAGSLTPIASLSAGTAGGIFLSADGSLQTTAYQTLSLGGGNTGNIAITTPGGYGGAGILSINGQTGATSASLTCVSVEDGIVTAVGGCGAGAGGSVWTVAEASGVIYPQNPTLDLLIGGISTASAKFAVLNVAGSQTPVASVSAGTAGAAFLSADGNLQTTAKQSLTLGGGNTGNVVLSGAGTGIVHTVNGVLSSSAVNLNTGSTDISGILSIANGGSPFEQNLGAIIPRLPTQDFLFGGLASSSATFHLFGASQFAGTNPVASIAAKTSFAGLVVDNSGDGDLFTASSSGLNRFVIKNSGNIGIGTDSPLAGLQIGDYTSSALPNNWINIAGGSTNTNGYAAYVGDWTNAGQWGIGQATNSITDKTIRIGLVDQSSPTWSTSQNIRLIVNGALGRSALAALDVQGANATLPVASISGDTSFAGLVVDNSGAGDLFTASSSGLTRFVIAQNGNVGIGTTLPSAEMHIVQTSAKTEALRVDSITDGFNGYAFDIRSPEGTTGVGYSGEGRSLSIFGGTSFYNSPALFVQGNGGDIIGTMLGSSSTNIFKGTAAVASIAAQTSFATLVVDNSGSGDLFTASSSGLTRFVIAQNGNVQITGLGAGVVHANSTGVLSSTTVSLTSEVNGILPIANGGSPFEQTNNGAITERITTQDLLLGGIATTSAKFAFTGVAGSSTPIASISANPASGTTTGIVLNGNGNIQGLNKNTLTLGGTSTGNIAIENPISSSTNIVSFTSATEVQIKNHFVAGSNTGSILYNAISNSANSSHSFNANNDLFIEGRLEVDSTIFADGNIDGGQFFWDNTNDRLGVGIASNLAGTLDVRATSGTLPIATLSARTSFAGLLVDNSLGDIFAASSSGLNRFVINNNGNVGVGTTNPATHFEISGTGNQYARVTATDTSDVAFDLVRSGTDWRFLDSLGSLLIRSGTDDFATAGTTRMIVTNTGRMGIGNGPNTPNGTLEINGVLGTIPVASVAGATSFASMIVDNSGVGDLFTASRSGMTKFTIGLDRVQIGTGSATGAGGAETPQLLGLDSKGSTGDPSGGRQGDMYYNTVDEKFRCYQGTGWTDCIAASTAEYLQATRIAVQPSIEIASGNRIGFNIASASAGSSISLNTGSYAGGAGQVTLAAGRTYHLTASIPYATFSGNGYLDYRFYNVTTGAYIGDGTGFYEAADSATDGRSGGNAEAVITTTATTVVELRMSSESLVTAIGSPGLDRFNPHLYVEVISGAQSVSASEYLRAEQRTNQTTNLTQDTDRLKMDTVDAFSGTSITLNTTSTYGNGLGQFTLKAGKTYLLRASVPDVTFTDSSTLGHLGWRWYNVTSSSYFGSAGITADTEFTGVASDGGYGGYAEAIITPSTTTTVEIRLNAVNSVTQIGNSGANRYPNAFIEVISDGTQVAQFTGATSAADGAIGYIPAPLAGQQGSLLLGNGTWTAATNVAIGTTLTQPIASLSARTSFAGLVVDNTGSGDLFTASSSGLTRFTIGQTGNLQFTGNTNFLTTLTSAATAARTLTAPDATGTICISGQTCSTSGVVGLWSRTSGAISPSFITDDLLIGGTASSSALFRVTGASKFAGTTSVASIAANTSFAGLVVDNKGKGDLFTASSSGQTRFTVEQNGLTNVGNCTNSSIMSGYSSANTKMAICQNSITAGDYLTRMYMNGTGASSSFFLAMYNNFSGNPDTKFSFETAGTAHADGTWTTGGADYAEYFYTQDTSLDKGDLVALSPIQQRGLNNEVTGTIAAASGSATPVGVVSSRPGFIGTLSPTDGTDDEARYENDPHYKPIGMTGQVPLKVTDKNGAIKPGDPITTSSLPKYGGKATQAGDIIGRSLDAFPGTSCQAVSSMNDIVWPADERGINAGNPCFTLPDGSHVGKIMIYLKPTIYDPSIALSDTGNISLFDKGNGTYGVTMPDGSQVQRTGIFSDAVIGNLKSGSLDVQSLSLGGQNLNDTLLGLQNGFASASAGFASPFADLQTQVASLGGQVVSLNDRVASLEAALTNLTSLTSPIGSFTASTGAELNLDKLTVNGTILADSLSVIHDITTNNLAVNGTITSGLIKINGATGDISTLNGDLKLQDQGYGGIDILNGKITIDTDGNLTTLSSLTAQTVNSKKFNIDTTDVSAASAGVGTIVAGTKTTIINTTAVTANSLIQVTFTSDYSPATRYWIKTKTAGTSFTVQLDQNVTANAKFTWFIVN